MLAERAENEAVLAVADAHDQQITANAPSGNSQPSPSEAEHPTSVAQTNTTEATVEPQATLPVGHAYYFIQVFDADKQVLRTVGSFFSKLEANVKASIRKHMQWPIRKDFLMWKRVDGMSVTTLSPADNFMDVVVPHGSCIIVGEKLSKDK